MFKYILLFLTTFKIILDNSNFSKFIINFNRKILNYNKRKLIEIFLEKQLKY